MNGESTWRASREWLGGRPPRWEVPGLTWEAAREALRAELAGFLSEQDCPHCIGQAQSALDELDRLAPGEGLRESADGTDYVLAPVESA